MAKSVEQVTGELVSLIQANFAPRLIDTRIGTVVRDVFITPVATQISEAFDRLDQVEANQTILNPEEKTPEIMDGHGENFGVDRFAGSFAAGTVRFAKLVAPTSDIVIPAGTRVATQTTNLAGAITFTTLGSGLLNAASPPDTISGAEASVDVAVQAELRGTSGNVDSTTITQLLDPVDGVDLTFNPNALSGGKESQTNTEMAELIKARAQGRLGTVSGYKDLILDNFSVDDVEVIGPLDEDAQRAQFGGAVDIIVLNTQTIQSEEVFVFVDAATTVQLTPTFQPLESVVSLTGTDIADSPVTLSGPANGVGLGTDFDVLLDAGPVGRSIQDTTRIVLHVTTTTLKDGSTLTLTYNNNERIRVIQSFLELEENQVVGSDVLAKSGLRINASIEADIRVIPGFTSTSVIANTEDAINARFDTLALGEDLQESDVTTVIGNVAGVDSVDLSTFKLNIVNSDGSETQVAEIIARKQEFTRASAVTVAAI